MSVVMSRFLDSVDARRDRAGAQCFHAAARPVSYATTKRRDTQCNPHSNELKKLANACLLAPQDQTPLAIAVARSRALLPKIALKRCVDADVIHR